MGAFKLIRQFVILKEDIEPKTKHYIGLPPEVTGNPLSARPLPIPRFVLFIEEQNGFYLYRYDLAGNFAGDTYHGTIPDAMKQAKYEFNIKSQSQWIDIPKEEKSEINYVISYYKARELRRDQSKKNHKDPKNTEVP